VKQIKGNQMLYWKRWGGGHN